MKNVCTGIGLLVGLCVGSLSFAQNPHMEPGPKSPAESLKCIQVPEGFTVELMAHEPAVMDPIAFAWGPDGKFWVVEMGDYPLGLDGKNKHGGNVKFLTKSRPDGRYDQATVFLANLGYPTGVTPYKKGVIITCAPDIFYAEDTDGDGKADKKEILFTGFNQGNQQHRVNGLVYGLDGWYYGANGDSGGRIKSIKTGEVVDIQGRDFRIDPERGILQAQTGQSQFGRHRDDWGNWFGNNNSNPMFHYVLEDHYLKRNPHVFYPDPKVHISVTPGAAPVYPISKPLPRFNDFHTLNRFTSACSSIIYRDNLLGEEFVGNAFISEPVHNLVHREIVNRNGVTFKSERAPSEQKSEFLASSDNWFRPTMIQTGSDGALWIADMYRYVIEHPQWIPADWQKKLDLRAGHDLGRIYRVYPKKSPPRAIVKIAELDEAGLITSLKSPNGWTRDQAQRRLVESKTTSKLVRDGLEAMVAKDESPLARLHALATLGGLGMLTDATLRNGLQDSHSGVRVQALRQLERVPKIGNVEKLLEQLVNDQDPTVKLQLGLTLGNVLNWETADILGQYLQKNLEDQYLFTSGLSSVNKSTWSGTTAYLLDKLDQTPKKLILPMRRLAEVFGSVQEKAIWKSRPLGQVEEKSAIFRMTALAELLDHFAEASTIREIEYPKGLAKDDSPVLDKTGSPILSKEEIHSLLSLKRYVVASHQLAIKTLTDEKESTEAKLVALRVVGRGIGDLKKDVDLIGSFLSPTQPEEVQKAAIASLGRSMLTDAPVRVLAHWKRLTPRLRTEALDVLMKRPAWTEALLSAIEKNQVEPAEIGTLHRQRLTTQTYEKIRQRASKLFAIATAPDRQNVIDQYASLSDKAGDVAKGVKIFAKSCAACHQFAGQGNAIGPDLGSVADKSTQGLLISILDPNRAVESRYLNYLAITKTGLTLAGVLLSETSTTLTLADASGKKHELLREDIEELVSTGKSMMPEGLERDIPPTEMADLLAFLRANLPATKK